jgi:DNA-binding NarL/FixJ family response regulator
MASICDLTPRELEILQFVVAGKTNRTIASEIYISEKTVEFHLNNIYTKIGVRTRLMAGVWAIQQGLQTKRLNRLVCSSRRALRDQDCWLA